MSSAHDVHEDELREHLRMLGRHIEQRPPNFQRVWRNAQQVLAEREKTPRLSPIRWALAAASAVVVAAALLWMHQPQQHEPVAAPHIVDTTSVAPATGGAFDATAPTDFLLTAADEPRTPSVEQLTREIDALLNP